VRAEYRAVVAAGQGGVIWLGGAVACDLCGADLTADPRSGGYLFGWSQAIGPCCAARHEARAAAAGEQHLITARCPALLPFAAWVRALRAEHPAAEWITVSPGRPEDMQTVTFRDAITHQAEAVIIIDRENGK
jgi:hypothetical protein